MKLSDPVYKSLVVFNTAVVVVGMLVAVGLGIRGRDRIEERLNALFRKEMASSALSVLRSDDTSDPPALDLPSYDLKIGTQTLRRIEAQVQELVAVGSMSDDLKVWYPARFFHDGEEYKIKIRLRGDRPWHWNKAKKSWRLKFKKDRLFQGRRYLDIIIPQDKRYEIEHVSYQLARELGLLVPDSGFCNVRFNGVDFGAYFWMEKYGKEMVEKQGYPEGEIFRQQNVWIQTVSNGFGILPDYHTGSFDSSVREDDSLGYYAARWDHLVRLISDADDETFEREAPHVLEIEKYLKWNALTWLYGSTHSHWGDNLRWFYDDTSGLFEPILYDVSPKPIRILPPDSSETPLWRFEALARDRLARRVMRIPEYRQRRNEILWRLVTEDAFDAAELSDQYFRRIRNALLTGGVAASEARLEQRHALNQEILTANRRDLKAHLEFARMFVAPEVGFHDGDTAAATLKIVPDSRNRIVLDRVTLYPGGAPSLDPGRVWTVLIDAHGDERVIESSAERRSDDGAVVVTLGDAAVWTPVDERLAQTPGEWTLRLEFPGVASSEWKQAGVIGRVEVEARNSVTLEPLGSLSMVSPVAYRFDDAPISPMTRTAAQFIADSGLPFILDGENLTLPARRHRVNHDLTLPAGHTLVLQAGTVLEMAPGVSVVSYGPLEVNGEAASPVRIVPQVPDEPWGSFAVIRAGAPSRVRYLEVRGGSETRINGLYLSGQLCFYWSDVDIEHSRISDARADDGLNIKKARFSIRNSVLSGNKADAFDGDWVRGTIESSVFRDNGGDGIDTSGARIIVRDSILERMGDKAISAGENSEIVAFNNVIRDSEIGVASKDLSDVKLYSNVLYRNATAVALYRKKQIFGPATGSAVGCLFWENRRNVSMDAGSSFEAVAIGADRWAEEDESVAVVGLLRGDPAQHYTSNANGILHAAASLESSPFRIAIATEEVQIGAVTIPNLVGSPAGLAHPVVPGGE